MFGFNKKKRILIIGMPDLVLYCITALQKSRKNIVGVITSPQNDPTYDYMKDFLSANKLLHIENMKNFKDKNLLAQVRQIEPDIAFVCSFNFLLPKELYEIPKLGTLNFHPSLLPDYRGPNPYFHVINNKEKETGVTMHFLDEKFDTGDIVEQIKVEVADNETMGTLFAKLNTMTAKLCVETVNFLERGGTLNRISQNEMTSSKVASKIRQNSDDIKINWNTNVEDIERFIRALNPFFGAVSCYDDEEIKFWDVEFIKNPAASSLPAGTVVDVTPKSIVISANDGFIITKVFGIRDDTYISDTCEAVKILNLKKGRRFE